MRRMREPVYRLIAQVSFVFRPVALFNACDWLGVSKNVVYNNSFFFAFILGYSALIPRRVFHGAIHSFNLHVSPSWNPRGHWPSRWAPGRNKRGEVALKRCLMSMRPLPSPIFWIFPVTKDLYLVEL